jgi:large subunit ribosomal protein L25
MEREITVNIPIHLVNTPAGVADGGVLQHILRELTVSCLPDNLIDQIELDISGLGLGDSLHVGDIVLPEGIRTDQESHLTVAVVAAPAAPAKEGEEVGKVEGKEEAQAEGEGTEEEES